MPGSNPEYCSSKQSPVPGSNPEHCFDTGDCFERQCSGLLPGTRTEDGFEPLPGIADRRLSLKGRPPDLESSLRAERNKSVAVFGTAEVFLRAGRRAGIVTKGNVVKVRMERKETKFRLESGRKGI